MPKNKLLNALKALANDRRLEILEWLKEPKKHFPGNTNGASLDEIGVSVSIIQEKSGLSQSTISSYMSTLEDAGLVTATRMGQWTFYRRNNKTFKELGDQMKKEV